MEHMATARAMQGRVTDRLLRTVLACAGSLCNLFVIPERAKREPE
jgi:hypothetical protein